MEIVVAESNVQAVIDASEEQIRVALEAIALQAEGYAILNCPVDTGRLRDSITHEVEDNVAYIGTNVEYAPYVEFNDNAQHKVGKAHFIRDAVADHSDEYKQIADTYLREK